MNGKEKKTASFQTCNTDFNWPALFRDDFFLANLIRSLAVAGLHCSIVGLYFPRYNDRGTHWVLFYKVAQGSPPEIRVIHTGHLRFYLHDATNLRPMVPNRLVRVELTLGDVNGNEKETQSQRTDSHFDCALLLPFVNGKHTSRLRSDGDV